MNAPEPNRLRLLAAAPWIVVLAGVLVMIILFVLTAGYLSADRRSSGAPDPVWPFAPGATPTPPVSAAGPEIPTPTAGSPVPTSAAGGAPRTTLRPTPSRSTRPPAQPTSAAPPSAPKAELTGRYWVVDDDDDSFAAEVLIRNVSSTSGGWTVELRFRDEVDDLWWFGVDSEPRPELQRSDGRYIFKGVNPVAGGSSARLGFRFERRGYRGETPISCTVNGRACEIA